MSGQGWEVVCKGNKKPAIAAKKMSKVEKKKFVENAPKIEDIVPLDQLNTLYNTLDNKENNKVPLANNGVKGTGAKKPKKKTQEKQKDPVKVVPKSLTIAANMLNLEELVSVVELNRNRFPDVPLLWLKSLAEYLNIRLAHSGSSPLSRPKDSLLSLLPSNVRDFLKKTLHQAGSAVLQPFFHHCLAALANEMSKGNVSITGHKILLQLVACHSGLKISDVDVAKVASLRQSYQNQQPIGLTILWALGQLGLKDANVGLQIWKEFMLPLVEMRNYSAFIVQYLEDISALQQGIPLSCESMLSLLDFIHSDTLTVSAPLRLNLYNATSALMKRSLQFEPETRPRVFFQPLLERLTLTCAKPLREELVSSLILCLKLNGECFAVWQKLYEKNTAASAILLQHLRSSTWKSLNPKLLRDTLASLQMTSLVLLKGKTRGDSVQQCQAVCEELLGKMTRTRSFPWNFCSFLLLISIAGLVTYDIQKHGSFKESSTGIFLRDVGVLKHANTAWDGTKRYSSAGYVWAQENVPVYYRAASETVKPYLGQAKEVAVVVGSHLNQTYWNVYDYTQEKAPIVKGWVNHYAPGLIEGIQIQSLKAWGFTKEYTFMLGSFAVKQSNNVFDWAKTNIFVGNLSPEKLQQYSQEAINTTQVYAAWTYDWVREKVHTLSKVQ